jgi:hypothetical protein
MDLVVQQSNELTTSPLNRGLPTEHELLVFNSIAKQAAESKFYNNLGGQSGIMMTILAAREIGVPPMLALNGGISNIQGKLEISARLMNALMRRAGIKITIKESTDELCTVVGARGDTGDTATVSYTLEDAKKAGLVKPGGGWVKNPKDMCFARAISRLARQIAPDVIGGCYVEGEIRATDAEVVIPVEETFDILDKAEEEKQEFDKLLDLFDKEDQYLILEYMRTVMKHFSWTQAKTVKAFLEDEKLLIDKFNTWKSKRKIV